MKQIISGIVGMALVLSLPSVAHTGQPVAERNAAADQATVYAPAACPAGFAENDQITIWDDADQQWYEGRITACLQDNEEQILLITYTAADGQAYELSTTVEPAEEEAAAGKL